MLLIRRFLIVVAVVTTVRIAVPLHALLLSAFLIVKKNLS